MWKILKALSAWIIAPVVQPSSENMEFSVGGHATLCELPEVVQAAKRLYPDEEAWERFQIIEEDFRFCEFSLGEQFGLIVLSNFLHVYGRDEARELLLKAVSLLAPDGFVLIHDYFPDIRGTRSP
ncbi:class I SAM-dependent methyltransferase [Desulfobacterales bacterium HSG2]|nr:class I SAM-dependent methyltransferase [Desulfobacterales bacterium HSG2]